VKSNIKPIKPLSPQQQRILQLLVNGYSKKEIAFQMALAPDTVVKYIRRARLKFYARTCEQMIALAVVYECITVHINLPEPLDVP